MRSNQARHINAMLPELIGALHILETPIFVASLSSSVEITFANEALVRTVGGDIENLVGRDLREVFANVADCDKMWLHAG
ncbi:hypothetical protein KDL45_17725, partial [bacterium]|nr:hypothetical protein [bacterium]